ncbi:hypothetical protein [Pseudooceanicola sp.]|uniref:hypothetical protein n=1 Tax=Pseudooceanicola sp. TaxID=1914328 RepID=UPI0026103258|nr:hypothetical protein [Pseudooceanicola sp.]MDF1856309.1 hypothetical protein [Pseudooceanicola sp.]
MILHLFRLSLSERNAPNLFEENDTRFQLLERIDYLFKWFGDAFSYEPRKGVFLRFIPTQIDDTVIAGIVARQINEIKHSDEDDPFREIEGIEWETANLFLNVGDDEQVVGVEQNRKISAQPRTLIQDLVTAINEVSKPGGYKIDVFPVHDGEEFWQAVNSYGGPITSLTFDLVVPNPPDTTSPTKEAMCALQEKLKMRSVKETYGNQDGLDLHNDFVEDREKYAAAGGGDVVAKSSNETVFSSKDSVKKIEVDDDFRASGTKKDGLADSMRDRLKR